MSIDWSFAWWMLLVLGIFHGINPAMGWLFAVGLGLQEQRRAAVWRALLPLALGHGLAIAAAILGIGMLGMVIPVTALKWGVAVVLFSFGVYRLFRQKHPRYGGMQVGPRELTIWSFLMASAHGAGLMVLPFIFKADASMNHAHAPISAVSHGAHTGHMESMLMALPAEPLVGFAAMLVHTMGYLLVTAVLAVIVYEKLGLRLLRSVWLNLDLIWAAALIVTAILTPLL
jgi:hypothetical protein